MKPWWNWRDAIFGSSNPEYRKAFLQDDVKQARIFIIAAAFMVVGYIYADYLALQSNPLFYFLAVLRSAFFGVSIWLSFYLAKTKNIKLTDYSILAWNMSLVFLSLFASLSKNSVSIENISFNYLFVLSFYLLIPNRQLFKIIPALTVSPVSIYILLNYGNMNVPGITEFNLIFNFITVVAINVIGILSSLQFDAQRYHQYLIQKTLLAGREQLRELAITDSLTGTLNRRGFLQMADVEFDRYKRYGETFSFVIIDLDKLKSINDTYGHPVGDQSLQRLVEVIVQEKRSSDTTGRLAGDEFGLLLPYTNPEQALEVMLRIKNVLTSTVLNLPNEQQVQISFSAGVTEANHADKSFDDIYRRADKALFLAKDKGRNKIEKA